LLRGLFHVRSSRLKAGDRGAIITDVAQVLSSGHGAAQVHGFPPEAR